jgi:hypothetical protein
MTMETMLDFKMQVGQEQYTLANLQSLQVEWLAAYADTARQIAAAAIELGERYEHELPYPWSQRPSYRLNAGNVKVDVTLAVGDFLPGKQEFNQITYLKGYVGVHLVVDMEIATQPTGKIDNLFVPGNWLTVIEPIIERAKQNQNDRQRRLEEIERQTLMRRLLIGVEV